MTKWIEVRHTSCQIKYSWSKCACYWKREYNTANIVLFSINQTADILVINDNNFLWVISFFLFSFSEDLHKHYTVITSTFNYKYSYVSPSFLSNFVKFCQTHRFTISVPVLKLDPFDNIFCEMEIFRAIFVLIHAKTRCKQHVTTTKLIHKYSSIFSTKHFRISSHYYYYYYFWQNTSYFSFLSVCSCLSSGFFTKIY